MSKLNIDSIVNVVVSTAGVATARKGFNVGLIVGASEHITTADRCKAYNSLDAMVDDGFLETDPEYKAAALYFAADARPQKVVIGRKDATQGSTETWVQAVTDCMAKSADWYGCYLAGTVTAADLQAVATYLETKVAALFYDSADAADIGTANTGKIGVMKGLSFKRAIGLYSTTTYAGAALMGYAMGGNDGTPNSHYTLKFKTLPGVTPDDLGETEVTNCKAKNGNVYVCRSATYNQVEDGVCANGGFFDELIGLDQLANDMQLACMDVLKNARKVPYTDAGALQFVLACNGACQNAVRRGFLAPGIWQKDAVLNLNRGDMLETGYLCQAEAVADQAESQKLLRICPPIYVCANLAGAIHSVAIKVIVQ